MRDDTAPAHPGEKAARRGLHIYGIVPADVEVTAEVAGVGEPAGPVMLSASVVPTLPMRFGAVVRDEMAVIEELLSRRREEFAAALGKLGDRCEFLVRGRYRERAVPRVRSWTAPSSPDPSQWPS